MPAPLSPLHRVFRQKSAGPSPTKIPAMMSRPNSVASNGEWGKLTAASGALRTVRLSFAKRLSKKDRSASDVVAHTASVYADAADGVLSDDDLDGAVSAIEHNVNQFMQGIPVLVKMLDEVAKLHPFVGVAVLAFKAVYTLEMTRRENDKKIVALYVEMKDMMAALVQLRNVKDEEDVGPGGLPIKARMQEVITKIADDIKSCANTCDTYFRTKHLIRVLKGPLWDGILVKLARLFVKRRDEFEFALAAHTSIGVDAANKKLDDVQEATKKLDKKMDVMLQFFQLQASPHEQDLADLIDENGGPEAALQNESILRQLHRFETQHAPSDEESLEHVSDRNAARRIGGTKSDLERLKEALDEDPSVAIERNFDTFDRKFKMQQRQIVEELSRAMHREGDRIITEVTAGPHDKIIDPNLHAIWKDMGWRGSVKARHLVLALRDHYREGMEDKKRKQARFEIESSCDVDEWALEYITMAKLQPITEAFDDDASGMITVAEANDLTTSRPLGWSLPHWLAYWAIGWRISASIYIGKIHDLITKMYAIRSLVHPANQYSLQLYLNDSWRDIMLCGAALKRYQANDTLLGRFKGYFDDEEDRLRENLEAIRYRIDGTNTIALVAGRGRIEKCLFPLIYLLMSRHFEIMRLARTNILHSDELWDAGSSLEWLFTAWKDRYKHLRDIFKERKLDLEKEFEEFASGTFRYYYFRRVNHKLPEEAILRKIRYSPYDDSQEAPNIKPEAILLHPLDNEQSIDTSAYDMLEEPMTETDLRATGPLQKLLGRWSGFLVEDDAYGGLAMTSFWIHASSIEDQSFEAVFVNEAGTASVIHGSCSVTPEGQISVALVVKFVTSRWSTQNFEGILDEAGLTFSGMWFNPPEGPREPFIFTKIPPEVMCFRPEPAEFEKNKIKALWRYALNAVEDQVRRNMFSWSFLRRRRDIRKRFNTLLTRYNDYGRPLDDEEQQELNRLTVMLTTADARVYFSMRMFEFRTTVIHSDANCDVCRGIIGGTRFVCLDCVSKRGDNVDLCDDARCTNAEVGLEERPDLAAPHLPSHTLMKLRVAVPTREADSVTAAGCDAVRRAKAAVDDGAENRKKAGRAADRTAEVVEHELACVACKTRVAVPCWYCIECSDDTFICVDCDAKGLPDTAAEHGSHRREHHLVKYQGHTIKTDHAKSVEDRMKIVERRLESLESKVDDMRTDFAKALDQILSAVVALNAKASEPPNPLPANGSNGPAP